MVHFTVVDSGCKINVKNDFGVTPVHTAVRVKNVADVERFLKNNADANLQDPWGNTPLYISSRHGFSNISQLSIDFGCNKSLKNREGNIILIFLVIQRKLKEMRDMHMHRRRVSDINVSLKVNIKVIRG